MKNRTQDKSNYPLLRLLVPYISGVLFFYIYSGISALYLSSFISLLIFITYLFYRKSESFHRTLCIHLFIICSAFTAGYINMYLSNEKNPSADQSHIFHACVIDYPMYKDKGIQVTAQILDCETTNAFTHKQAQLFLSNHNPPPPLKPGSILVFNAYLQSTDRPSPPGTFDYNAYLRKKDIHFTAFVDSNSWESEQHIPYNSARIKSATYRLQIREYLNQIYSDESVIALSEALLLGEKQSLNETQKDNFRKNGISHLLAVSGFHVGLIYSFIFAILIFIPRNSRFYKLRLILPLPILFFYCFLVGSTPSVLRAVCMITIYTLAALFEKDRFSLNTLFFAAIVLLVYNPLFILDLGFQLSFLAVLSILLMQSFSANLFIHKHKSIRIICSYLLICISAQIMTAPLVSYYFGLFPSNFLIANIISLPFIYILFGGSIFALLLRSFHLPYFWLGGTIEKLNNWFEDILKYLRELPHATFDYTLNTKELIGIYIIYFAVLLFIRNHRKFAICTLSMFIVFIVFYEFNQTQTLHLIPVKNQASIILQTDKKLVCFHQDTLTSESKRLLKRDLNATQIHQRTSESLLEINGNKILRLDTDTLRKRITTQPRQVELLILSQGCKDSLSHILTLFTPKHIILDADLSNYWRNLWKNEASQLNCEVYDLNEIGYFTQQL